MTGRVLMNTDISQSPFGVLSNDEELVVSLVREVLGKLRADRQSVDIAVVEAALIESGARMERDGREIGSKVFTIQNARFFVQSCSSSQGGVELVFVDANR